MDPLSLTLAVATLGGAAASLGKAVKAVSRLKDANAEVSEATENLFIIKEYIKQLEQHEAFIGNSESDSSGIHRITNAGRSLITAIEETFSRADDSPQYMKKFRWVLKDRKSVMKLQSQLNNLSSLVVIFLQMESAEATRSLIPVIESFLSQQEVLYNEFALLKNGISSWTERPVLPPPPPPIPTELNKKHNAKMRVSSMHTWLGFPCIMIQYCRSAGRHKQQSILFGLKLVGSKVVFVRLATPWQILGLPSLYLRVRNIIPEDAGIIQACKAGDVLKVRELLQDGKSRANDITATNETILTAACDSRSTELVELLLGEGADPDQTCGRMQTSPLHVAFELNEPDIARRLLYHGADIDYTSARGWNAIHHIWETKIGGRNSQEFYQICSSAGFSSYDAQDEMGWTCLHRAAAFGTPKDIESILRLGASPTLYTHPHGWSPIHVAAVMNNVDTLKALSTGLSPQTLHAPDAHGWTPLHLAVDREAESTMRFLLLNYADPHAYTYLTAKRFPVGREHEIFCPGDLARENGSLFLQQYADALQESGWKVTTGPDGDDVYWDVDQSFDQSGYEKSPPYEEKGTS